MSKRREPGLDERRESDFKRELQERAQLWMPSWDAPDGEPDFAQALLAIAARFNAEVAERLDKGAAKMALGFLYWLAIRGQAAIPARMPVVFKLGDKAAPLDAPAPVQLQVDAMGTSLVFETERDVRLVPSRLQMVVGADSAADAYYLPAPGLTSLDPLEPLPLQWQLRSFAAPGSHTLQLDPPLGLAPGMLLRIGDDEFRVDAVNDDLVTIDPAVPPGAGFDPSGVIAHKVSTFQPFGDAARNRQFHALYLGHPDLLNIESEATIALGGAAGLPAGVAWHYWGTSPTAAEEGWQAFLPGSNAAALSKPKGEIAKHKIGEVESRWIRASIGKVAAGAPGASDALTLTVNKTDLTQPCPPTAAEGAGGVDGLEAMANSTPLDMADIFYPLGREPRQFDAFYLGSAEAFSKHGAAVRMCLDMADLSFTAFASMRVGLFADQLLAGVAQDGHLHLFRFNPGNASLTAYPDSKPRRPPAALDLRPAYRSALWSRANNVHWRDAYIAVASGATAWVWMENGFIGPSSWKNLGALDPTGDPAAAIGGFVYLADSPTSGKLCALLGERLFICNPDADRILWLPVEPKKTVAGPIIALAKIAPIVSQSDDMVAGSMANGLLAVGTDGMLYHIDQMLPVGDHVAAGCTELLDGADPTVAPAGVKRNDGAILAVAACENGLGLRVVRAWLSTSGATAEEKLKGSVIGHSIDVHQSSGQLVFALSLQLDSGAPAIAWWSPFNPALSPSLVSTAIPASVGAPAGAPTLTARHVLVPALANQVLVANFSVAGQQTFIAPLQAGVITALSNLSLAAGDQLAVNLALSDIWETRKVVSANSRGGETLYELDAPFSEHQDGDGVLAYRSSVRVLMGTASGTRKFKLDPADLDTGVAMVLLVETGPSPALYEVDAIAGARVATLDRAHGLAAGAIVSYWRAEPLKGWVMPMLTLDAISGNWDAELLERIALRFPGAVPQELFASAFALAPGTNRPLKVALRSVFTTPPASGPDGVRFVVDGTISGWSRQLGDTQSNQELSWEYWNGAAWWKLPELQDDTLHLKRSGAIRFKVPDDLQPTDWAGKTNRWIRARLVGGDYGQARTVVKSVALPGGVTEQTVERTTDDIDAPQVLRLRLQYSSATPLMPLHVLTADSGALRDQSDANRTPDALVTMFTHLASAMPPSAGQGDAGPATEGCPSPCACQPGVGPVGSGAGPASAAPGRAIYLGFSAALSGQPVNLLVLVDKEQPFAAFAPLKIEALSGEYFVPVVAEDTTRALGESGLLSLSLTLPTLTAGLFGSALCWLRLSPSREAAGAGWTPSLRGVYINAAWARAAETMTRERLGSSTGAPGQVLMLARPPLLQDTLELRVREALSGEEREALLAQDEGSVVSDVASDLRGHWVRWRQVTDVDDCGPLERAYSLDETSGAVRFGDGLHGMIPPTGRDAVVAFSYQRTEPGLVADGVPANGVSQRTKLNLITPLEGVEAAFAADQSAGGAPPDSAQRVQRFAPARLRHRGRALTLADVEDHALQSSPDIVQARALRDAAGVRLVLVMRGADVQPSQAARRELRRTLQSVAPPALALRIDGPAVRRLRIGLALRIGSLDTSGQLANSAKQRVAQLFDPAAGGLHGVGWPLGATPAEDDIALALLDAPHLEAIEAITFAEIGADGSARPWRGQVRPHQLVMLAADGLRIEFVIPETEQ